MPYQIGLLFGAPAVNVVRTGLTDRASYATQLTQAELAPFLGGGGGPPTVVQLVNALVPAAGGGLTLPQFRTFITTLGTNAGSLTGRQISALVGKLAPLTPAQISALLLDLVTAAAGPIQPVQAQAMIIALRSGGHPITADEVRRMFTRLRGQLSPTELHDVINELLPATGTMVRRIYVDLCHTGGGGLGGTAFRAFVRTLRASPGHANALTTSQIDAIVHDLRAGPLTGTEMDEIVDALITNGGRTPVQLRTLVDALRLHITAAQVHDLITTTNGNPGNLAITPAWLLNACAELSGGQPFAFHLNAGIAHNANGFTGMRQLVARMDQAALPVAWAPKLLELFLDLTGNAHNKLRNFISDGAAAVAALTHSWANDVLTRLQGFLTAARAPHGASTRYAQAGMGGATVVQRDINDASIFLRAQRLNYFCNSHTYRFCHFSNRIALAVASIEFWPAAKTRQGIVDEFNAVPDNWVYARAGEARAANGGYAMQVYNNALEVGIESHGWNNGLGAYEYYVTHLSPAGQNRVPMQSLQAISNLFDD